MGAFQIVATISVGGDTDRRWVVVCVRTNRTSRDNLKCTRFYNGFNKEFIKLVFFKK
ncbi:MAG: hypothetical protein ABIO82_05460 [Ginsengibacter sp.]